MAGSASISWYSAGDILTDVSFTTTFNLEVDTTTIPPKIYWKPTAITTPVYADGIASVGIPAGQDGYYQSQLDNVLTTQQFGIILHTSSTVASNPFYNIADYMVYRHVSGNFYVGEVGVFSDTGVACVPLDYFRLRRTGSTIVAEYNRSGSWITLYTFGVTSSAKLYAGCSADNANAYEVQLLKPEGFNLS